MINLKKIIFAASIAVASLGFSLSSQAVLVSHDILLDDVVVGEVSVSLLENGAQSIGVEFIEEFVSLSLNGKNILNSDLLGGFLAVVDGDNIFAGIDQLFFEFESVVQEIYAIGFYDAFSADPAFDNTLDIEELQSFVTGQLSLSTATVVSEPSVLALFALALIGFGMRRRAL